MKNNLNEENMYFKSELSFKNFFDLLSDPFKSLSFSSLDFLLRSLGSSLLYLDFSGVLLWCSLGLGLLDLLCIFILLQLKNEKKIFNDFKYLALVIGADADVAYSLVNSREKYPQLA
jgi:hypothetical protein